MIKKLIVPRRSLNLIRDQLSAYNTNQKDRLGKILIEEKGNKIEELDKNYYWESVEVELFGKYKNVTEFLTSVENLLNHRLDSPQYINKMFYLKNVVACSRTYGWEYRSNEKKRMSTHTVAMENIELRKMNARNIMGRREWVEPGLRDVKFVEKSLKWIYSTKESKPVLDKIIVSTKDLDYISIKDCPTIALLIKEFDLFRRTKIKDIEYDSMPLGNVEDEIKVECVVIRRKDFARYTWFSLCDDSGNKITWFSETTEVADIGDKLSISAVVSDIRHYREVCETVIKKVKINSYD